MRGIHGLEYEPGGLGVLKLQPLGGAVHKRRFVAQGLEQPQNTIAVLGRAQQHRNDETLLQVLDEIGKHLVAGWLGIRQQLLHQFVIVVGELLEHLETRFALALLDGRRHLDDLRLGMRAIDKGALEREVDEAGGRAVLPDRDLAQHQRPRTGWLQDREDVTHTSVETVDLVQEQKSGNATVFELLQDQLQRRNALGIGLADHDSGIAAGERKRTLMLKFYGTGAVDEGEGVAEEADIGNVELNAHTMVASFLG